MTARTVERGKGRFGREHRRTIGGLVAGMVILALIGAIFIHAALDILSGGRAYIHSEGRWSKGQQEAVFFLDRYAERGDPADLARAREALDVPLGDREARQALVDPAHDPEQARRGFRRGGNHPDDIPGMIRLLEHFAWAPWFREAIDIWEQADIHILRLQELAGELERHWRDGRPPQTVLADLRNEITIIDQRLRGFETRFSATLNEGLRVLEFVLALAGALLLLLLAAFALLVFRWATRRIRASEQRFWTSFAHAPMGLALLSHDGRFTEVNEVLCRILGQSRERLLTQSLDAVMPTDGTDLAPLLLQLGDESAEIERRLKRSDGNKCWCRLGVQPIPAGPDAGFIVAIEDISEAKQRNEELSWRATHDALTGLLNRSQFQNLLTQAIRDCHERSSQHVLGFIDLDEFKTVNDTCGHAAGDKLLQELARLMPQHLRAADVMARLGGDEFVFLLRDCPLQKGEMRAERLRRSVADYVFEWKEQYFDISTSIGVVVLDGTIKNADEALDRADHACYRAKNEGRNRIWVDGTEVEPTREAQRPA